MLASLGLLILVCVFSPISARKSAHNHAHQNSIEMHHHTMNASDCSDVITCNDVDFRPDCGWCWYASTTLDQKHGGRPGNINGPTDGALCNDWTFVATECHYHVDCPSLPDCLNILGTYCGWCGESNTALRGDASGPLNGTCNDWIWSANYTMCPVQYGPQQIHIAFGQSANSIVVAWASVLADDSNVIYYPRNNPSNAITVPASQSYYNDEYNPSGAHFYYNATLNNLLWDTTYDYFVITGTNQSNTFNFTTVPAGSDWVQKYIVYGDMGRHGGGMILQMVENEIALGDTTAIIHAGDFAYDLEDDGGINGDTFMNRIQKIATTTPYMTCVGNHETDGGTFSNYLNRFYMPKHGDVDMMWFSWNMGLVHFISYSTEVFYGDPAYQQQMYDWIVADLTTANEPANRALQPWIIVFGHRPMYCSNLDLDCPHNVSVRLVLEPVFHQFGVDVVIEAHEHSYERLWPVYNYTVTQFDYFNPKAMVHLVTGAAGCNEGDGACLNPILFKFGEWSAFHSSVEGTYSYGHMRVYNSTHLYWDSYVAEEERIEDFIWIVQEHHGMRL